MQSVYNRRPREQLVCFHGLAISQLHGFLDSNSIFYSIAYPISIRADCNNKTTIYNLTESCEIGFSDQCEFNRVVNKIQFDVNTFTTYEIDEPMHRPNFSVYDTKSNNWTDDFHMIEKSINLIKLASDAEERHNDLISSDAWYLRTYNCIASGLSDAWHLIRNNIILSICFYTFALPLMSFIGYMLMSKIKNKSFQKCPPQS